MTLPVNSKPTKSSVIIQPSSAITEQSSTRIHSKTPTPQTQTSVKPTIKPNAVALLAFLTTLPINSIATKAPPAIFSINSNPPATLKPTKVILKKPSLIVSPAQTAQLIPPVASPMKKQKKNIPTKMAAILIQKTLPATLPKQKRAPS